MNLVEAKLERSNGSVAAVLGSQKVPLGEAVTARPALESFEGRDVILGIRPEDLEDAAEAQGDGPTLDGRVTLREALGSEIMVHFETDARSAVTDEVRELAKDAGDEHMADRTAKEAKARMIGRFSPRSRVKTGSEVKVAVDTRSLHFFDPATGLGIYDGKGVTA